MFLDRKHSEYAEIHCLIVPLIIGETKRNYADFIAFMLEHLPVIIASAIQDYNEGELLSNPVEDIPAVELPEVPSPEPEFTEARVNAWVLTVRAGPGTTFEALRHLRKNQVVKVYDHKTGWALIDPKKFEWVSSIYITPL